jgi:four helix bundle protein
MYKDFYELQIWKDGYDLLMDIYKITESFPNFEKYSLTSQITRSSNSIIANIAESHGRYYFKDKIRVLYISRGEITETRSHLSVVYGKKYIDQENFIDLNNRYKQLAKDLNLYINSLKQ